MDQAVVLFSVIALVNLLLTVLTLQRMLSDGWVRKYFLLTVLLAVNILLIVPGIASYAAQGNWLLDSAHRLYWVLALLFELLIYVFLLQLTYRVGKEIPSGATFVQILIGIAVGLLALSITIHFDDKLNRMMSFVTRDLTFMAAAINLFLWRFLLKVKSKDFLVLTVCSGLGVQCTGDAVGLSLRSFGPSASHAGNLLMCITAVIALGIWHLGFSRSRAALIRAKRKRLPNAALDSPVRNETERSTATDEAIGEIQAR